MTTTYWADKELHIHGVVKGQTIDNSIQLLKGLLNVVDMNLAGDISDNLRFHQIEFKLIIEDYLDFYLARQDKIRRSLELGTAEYASASLAQWEGGEA